MTFLIQLFKKTSLPCIVGLLVFSSPCFSEKAMTNTPADSPGHKLLYANAGSLIFITGWGLINWDYGENNPTASSEDWFSKNTKEGGADKAGHFYSSYFVASGIASLCDSWGYSRNDAALAGALSSFGIMNYMELGDSFSNYGFSYEDFVMNSLGCLTGYLIHTHPEVLNVINLRVEYYPKNTPDDIITDYENMKYLIAIKGSGLPKIDDTFLSYFELQLGYYARGYDDKDRAKKRYGYIAFGLNLPRLFQELNLNKTAGFFNYFQPPYTYADVDLN